MRWRSMFSIFLTEQIFIKVFLCSPLFLLKEQGWKELREDRAVGQHSREGSRVWLTAGDGDGEGDVTQGSALGGMGWARATPLLVCISTEEKAFKPKKWKDFLREGLFLLKGPLGLSRLVPGRILLKNSFICSCLWGRWTISPQNSQIKQVL